MSPYVYTLRNSARALALVTLALMITAATAAASAPERKGNTSLFKAQGTGLSITPAPASALIACILGNGIQVSNAVLNGPAAAAGTFSGGLSIIGFASGIVLSTGDVTQLVGPNVDDGLTGLHFTPGDADLNALVAPDSTFDAISLEFDFRCDSTTAFEIEWVFGSEEYNEFVNEPFNDVFAFFLDGGSAASNIARVPVSCSTPNLPVSVNNVNCGNPYPDTGVNCGCFRNNDLDDGGGSIDTELDGLTTVFHRTITIPPGSHHMKIVIADTSDEILDSAVFIRCASLACAETTPVQSGTWGSLKTRYR